jgi:dolichol-phosphate mannosyltransferase
MPAESPLVVVVPVYNEGANFDGWWREAAPHLPPGAVVRPVYDMPEDDTLPVIERLRSGGAPLEPLRNAGRGVLKAMLTGLASVERGPVIVSMADLSDDLAIIPRMVEAWRGGAAVVVASRYMAGGRHLGGPPLKKLLSRLYDAEFLRTIAVESTGGFELALELTLKAWQAGRSVVEVPCTWRDRVAGESRFALRKWLPRYGRLWARAMVHGALGR